MVMVKNTNNLRSLGIAWVSLFENALCWKQLILDNSLSKSVLSVAFSTNYVSFYMGLLVFNVNVMCAHMFMCVWGAMFANIYVY